MTGKEMFQIWAPTGKKWVDWVRPVPFVELKEHSKLYNVSNFTIPPVDYIATKAGIATFRGADENWADAAVIVDLPGTESVEVGIALAKVGYRPIPIYNGTIEQQGARANVDNQSVGTALMWGASELSKIEISDDALPAFLTDSNRMHRFRMEDSLFDNSWDVYPQDLPSADYFLKHGIHKIIVLGESLSVDLKKILYKFQKKKIEIFLAKRYEAPKKIRIHSSLLDVKE